MSVETNKIETASDGATTELKWNRVETRTSESAIGVVRALAAIDPVVVHHHDGKWVRTWCPLCGGAARYEAHPPQHTTVCPHRLAQQFVFEHGRV